MIKFQPCRLKPKSIPNPPCIPIPRVAIHGFHIPLNTFCTITTIISTISTIQVSKSTKLLKQQKRQQSSSRVFPSRQRQSSSITAHPPKEQQQQQEQERHEKEQQQQDLGPTRKNSSTQTHNTQTRQTHNTQTRKNARNQTLFLDDAASIDFDLKFNFANNYEKELTRIARSGGKTPGFIQCFEIIRQINKNKTMVDFENGGFDGRSSKLTNHKSQTFLSGLGNTTNNTIKNTTENTKETFETLALISKLDDLYHSPTTSFLLIAQLLYMLQHNHLTTLTPLGYLIRNRKEFMDDIVVRRTVEVVKEGCYDPNQLVEVWWEIWCSVSSAQSCSGDMSCKTFSSEDTWTEPQPQSKCVSRRTSVSEKRSDAEWLSRCILSLVSVGFERAAKVLITRIRTKKPLLLLSNDAIYFITSILIGFQINDKTRHFVNPSISPYTNNHTPNSQDNEKDNLTFRLSRILPLSSISSANLINSLSHLNLYDEIDRLWELYLVQNQGFDFDAIGKADLDAFKIHYKQRILGGDAMWARPCGKAGTFLAHVARANTTAIQSSDMDNYCSDLRKIQHLMEFHLARGSYAAVRAVYFQWREDMNYNNQRNLLEATDGMLECLMGALLQQAVLMFNETNEANSIAENSQDKRHSVFKSIFVKDLPVGLMVKDLNCSSRMDEYVEIKVIPHARVKYYRKTRRWLDREAARNVNLNLNLVRDGLVLDALVGDFRGYYRLLYEMEYGSNREWDTKMWWCLLGIARGLGEENQAERVWRAGVDKGVFSSCL